MCKSSLYEEVYPGVLGLPCPPALQVNSVIVWFLLRL